MTHGIPSGFYQTKNKRRDYVAKGMTMYGPLGAAGPAVSLVTGEVLKPSKPEKPPKSNYKKKRRKKW